MWWRNQQSLTRALHISGLYVRITSKLNFRKVWQCVSMIHSESSDLAQIFSLKIVYTCTHTRESSGRFDDITPLRPTGRMIQRLREVYCARNIKCTTWESISSLWTIFYGFGLWFQISTEFKSRFHFIVNTTIDIICGWMWCQCFLRFLFQFHTCNRSWYFFAK